MGFILAACALTAGSAPPGGQDTATPSLHLLIDTHIEAAWPEHLLTATASSDAEFLRRVSLDLIGIVPTAAEARPFLESEEPDKRRHLIDALLARPEHAWHLARVLDDMLTERRVNTIKSYDVPRDRWLEFLRRAVDANRPWDQLVGDILASDGSDEMTGPAAKFYLSRDVKPALLTRDIGRIFLGIDLQCAQCHDDPRFPDYRQADYQGLFAFVHRMSHFHDGDRKANLIAEKAEGDVTFTSVFTGDIDTTDPRLPGGLAIPDPQLKEEERYQVKPESKVQSIPTWSRRLLLSRELPQRETVGFSQNIVNRLWATMLGRGLVAPVDLHHAANPPSHPDLLQALAHHFENTNYNIRDFLRELTLSKTYQRSSRLPAGPRPTAARFAVAPLRPLSAAQLGWSVLQVTERIATNFQTDAPQSPPDDSWRLDIYEPFEPDVQLVVSAFQGLSGQADGPFAPTAGQALFFLNAPRLNQLFSREWSPLVARLVGTADSTKVASELYLAVLTRPPSAHEVVEVCSLLDDVSELSQRSERVRNLVLGLLMSAEFRFNH